MPEITHARVLKHLAEVVRPQAERIRDTILAAEQMLLEYADEIAPLLAAAADADLIQDGRADEGINQLTAGDLKAFMGKVQGMADTLQTEGSMAALKRPAVRPPRIAQA